MTAFYVTFLAVLLAGIGARDQVTVANLSLCQGSRPGVLLTGLAVAVATATFAAWAASVVVPLLAAKGRLVIVTIALILAGAEALWPFEARQPEEPTASLGALGLVLLTHQVTDAARLLIFALAVALMAPVAVGFGGVAAGGAAIAAGWLVPEAFADSRLRLARGGLGAVMLVCAVIGGFEAFTA
jgi:hypothetical protein